MDGSEMLKRWNEVRNNEELGGWGDGGLGGWDGVLRTFFNAFGDKIKRNHWNIGTKLTRKSLFYAASV
jgi:hypothetical protein